MAEVLAAKEFVDIADKGIKAGSNAIDLYNKMVDQAIPWKTFDKYINDLKANKEQYSSDAAKIVGEVQVLLMNSKDSYDSSTMSVYRWCQTAVQTLQGCMELFKSISDPEAAKAQLTLFKETLKQGHFAMDMAIKELEKSNESFNEAAGKITTLSARLKLDFTKGSTYHDEACTKVKTEAYASAAAGVLGGPIGLAIAYAIAAGVVGTLIAALDKAFDETKALFTEMETMCLAAQTDINKAKDKVSDEVKVIGTIMAQIKTTTLFATAWSFVPSTMFDRLKDSTNKLIAMCEAYVKSKDDEKADAKKDIKAGSNAIIDLYSKIIE